jgi:hypothetical protein
MNKNAVISFASKKGNYVKSLNRLSESLRNNSEGIDFLAWIGEAALGAPLHSENMYAFKIHAFNVAKASGYDQILWVDSSCFAIKNVQPCFDEIERDGFLFQDSGYFASEYINDKALDYFGVTREQAREIKLIGNAGMMGLNFEMELPNVFFDKWEQAMIDKIFIGEWHNNDKTESQSDECKGHRHDLVNGIILHQMGLSHLMKRGDEWLQYAGVFDETLNDTIIWKAQGM